MYVDVACRGLECHVYDKVLHQHHQLLDHDAETMELHIII